MDKIEMKCETCNKELKTLKQYNDCFNNNHDLRSTGFFMVKEDILLGPRVKIGIALTNAKAGEEVIVRI